MHSPRSLHLTYKSITMKTLTFAWAGALVLALGLASASHPEHTIAGVVLDESQQPLIGASVVIRNSKEGTITDFEGRFTLTSPTKCAALEVHFVGYETETIEKACAGDKVKVIMKPSTALEEVVITGKTIGSRNKARSPRQDRAVQDAEQSGSLTRRMYSGESLNHPLSVQSSSLYSGAAGNREARPYPTGAEGYNAIQENRFRRTVDEPLSTFSIDVDAASYSNLRRFLNNNQLPPKDAVRIEEMINYFDYDYPQPGGEHPFAVTGELGACPWRPGHYLLHIGLQGRTIPTDDLPPSNLVFLIDVSGSMDQSDKLPLLQQSFELLTDQLRPQDRVAIVVYAGAAGMVLAPTPGDNKTMIKDAINQLQAGGSTAGAAGIQLAYQLARQHYIQSGNNRVILATDGDFNVGVSSDAALVELIERERESGIFLTVLGFGTGNYQDGKMQQLADKGNGNHAYIDNLSEAKKVLVREFGGTVFAIAKDVKLQLEFNPAQVAGYRLIGYENRLLNKEDFNDDKKDAGELGSGHTVTALYEIIPAGVESEFLTAVDDLKYQQDAISGGAEWLTVKLRYKKPTHDSSRLLEQTVARPSAQPAAGNFNWSAAMASFGMLLRQSEFRGEANYDQTIQLAETAKGKDPHGYRQEAIDLMRKAKDLTVPEISISR